MSMRMSRIVAVVLPALTHNRMEWQSCARFAPEASWAYDPSAPDPGVIDTPGVVEGAVWRLYSHENSPGFPAGSIRQRPAG
jgi:hypothetical protein